MYKSILSIKHIYNEYKIGKGFIHSYKIYSDARFFRSYIKFGDPDNKYKILEGIIPKGSIYYEDKITYCSNKLILDLNSTL